MFYAYMLASDRNGTLYVGHTDDLIERVRQHREKERPGFTAKYAVARLVWFETHDDRDGAFRRERQIKKWYRAWKLRTIEAANPEWRDLYDDLSTPDRPLHRDLVGQAVGREARLDPACAGMSGSKGFTRFCDPFFRSSPRMREFRFYSTASKA